jgi:hypothetical protein
METPTGLLSISDRHPFGSPRNTGSMLGNTSFNPLTLASTSHDVAPSPAGGSGKPARIWAH